MFQSSSHTYLTVKVYCDNRFCNPDHLFVFSKYRLAIIIFLSTSLICEYKVTSWRFCAVIFCSQYCDNAVLDSEKTTYQKPLIWRIRAVTLWRNLRRYSYVIFEVAAHHKWIKNDGSELHSRLEVVICFTQVINIYPTWKSASFGNCIIKNKKWGSNPVSLQYFYFS